MFQTCPVQNIHSKLYKQTLHILASALVSLTEFIYRILKHLNTFLFARPVFLFSKMANFQVKELS